MKERYLGGFKSIFLISSYEPLYHEKSKSMIDGSQSPPLPKAYDLLLPLLVSNSDVDECSNGAHVCSHNCHNTEGSYTCSCPSGYNLLEDNITCLGELPTLIIHISHIISSPNEAVHTYLTTLSFISIM